MAQPLLGVLAYIFCPSRLFDVLTTGALQELWQKAFCSKPTVLSNTMLCNHPTVTILRSCLEKESENTFLQPRSRHALALFWAQCMRMRSSIGHLAQYHACHCRCQSRDYWLSYHLQFKSVKSHNDSNWRMTGAHVETISLRLNTIFRLQRPLKMSVNSTPSTRIVRRV